MLKMIGMKLEKISDIDMCLFLEKDWEEESLTLLKDTLKQIINTKKFSEISQIGYILEVDLEYRDELHYLHNDYALAPEKLAIPYDMLSDYSKTIGDEYGIKVGDIKKLIPNLGDKTNYVLHYRNLQLYLSLGIHKVIKFKQSDWMEKCIDFNTEKKENAANSFEKNVFKLMSD